jgi:hypothetical protein
MSLPGGKVGHQKGIRRSLTGGLVSVSDLGACGTVEDEIRNRAQDEVDKQRVVEDEVEKGRKQVEERVAEEAIIQLLENGQ